ncbi:MAG: amino acid adenylation domain-containing protein [Betaproteobacteria bacterium]
MSTAPKASVEARKDLARFIIEQARTQQLDKERAAAFLQALTSTGPARGQDAVAVVGMACHFPQADSLDAFWANLLAGRSSIRPFPEPRRAQLAALDHGRTELFAGGFLDAVDGFDHEYFQIPPRVARHLDPYQRLMLHTLVETIEDAGYHRGSLYGKPVGIYVGNDHTHRLFNSYVNFIDEVDFHAVTGSWTAVLASRLSYLFNFKGPAVVVDTACSSGLVALDQAIKALRDGDCEVALVAAANLFFAPGKGLVGEIENDSFQVRAFDHKASGTAWGEGVAGVMIKPLAQALCDGDPIHAVLTGIALNNDGASNGLTAPNAKAQQEVLLKAWERAGIDPEALGYIETHGTGTPLGDPIEIKGLIGAFERHSTRRQFCAVGSVKTNIGHTVGVAGLASLLKVVLSLEHECIPPSIHFDEPNRHIDFCNSPVYVNDRVLPWPAGDVPRLAGVSSFSLSGTNCHLVVEEAPASACRPAARPPAAQRLVPLSARSPELFAETVRRWLRHLEARPELDLAGLALTAGVGREHHELRAAVLADTTATLRARLQRLLALCEAGIGVQREDGLHLCLTGVPMPGDSAERRRRDAAIERGQEGDMRALDELAALYVAGVPVNWNLLYQAERAAGLRRVNLPPQPFDGRPFWSKAPDAAAQITTAAADEPAALPTRMALLESVHQDRSRYAGDDGGEALLPQRVLAHLWGEVLGYERIAADDDFHALGGDSISAMKIVHVVNAVFGLQVPPTAVLATSEFGAFVRMLVEQHDFAHALGGEDSADAAEAITPLPAAASYPLSRAQRRMLLLACLTEGSTAYNVSAVVRVAGTVDVPQTAALMRRISARHEILRTGFEERDGELRQVVHADVPFAFEEITLPPAPDEAAELDRLHEAVRRFIRPFDLTQPPLLRMAVLHGSAGRDYLAIDMHHIVTDGSSMGVLVGEFAQLSAGASLAPLPFQYKDFAAWQNRRFDAGALAGQAAFWRSRFEDEVPALTLPTDYPRPAFQDYRGAKAHFQIPAELSERLRALARARGTTLYILLLAAFKVLLYKLGGGRDIVVGSPVSGRSHPALQGLIGMLVNTLALRDRIEPQDSFADFLARVRSNTLEALQHQDYPYEELVEQLSLPRNAGRNPLFDVCFSLQNEDIGVAGVEMVPLQGGSAKFDMTVMMRDTDAGLVIDWEYALALFKPTTVERFGVRFVRVLAAVSAEPERALCDLSLLDAAERAQLDAYNDTATAYGGELGIPALFAAQVRARPEAAAVQLGERILTYAALEREANRLANVLAAQGVRRGDRVALLHDRSIEQVVAILAVLKTGAAYVPLDIDNPPQRLTDILADAAPRLLLCGPLPPDATLPDCPGLPMLCQAEIGLSGGSDRPPEVTVNGDDLAYVMFTSGSTGRPKGTLIRHKSVIRVVRRTHYLDLGPWDRCLMISNYAFDGSIPDLFGALLNGGRVVLLSRQEVIDPERLGRVLAEQQISSTFITTALFNALVDWSVESLTSLRYLMVGGETASLRHMAQALAVLGPGKLIHCYGPTETTVFAVTAAVERVDPALGAVPIGRPISNTRVYVLDEDGQRVPHGVVGELYIGGDGVALGYLNRQELTAERFVPDPYAAGQTLYRTGDLVKWLDDGALLFIGRRDHQVKIRGFRIELGEIEVAIACHPAVKTCLVTADPDASGQRLLCAYVVPAAAPTPELEAQLRSFLATRVPDYMVPTVFMLLPAFVLNASGKIDRRTLPAPQRVQANAAAPRDEREMTLVQVWSEVLQLPAQSIHDNFFALGGDSIKAIQIVARLRAAGWRTEVALLFQHQTIAELAPHLQTGAALAAGEAAHAAAPAVAIDEQERDRILADLDIG